MPTIKNNITDWTLEEHRNNDTRTGLQIKEPSDQFSWYTNDNSDKVTTKDKRQNQGI